MEERAAPAGMVKNADDDNALGYFGISKRFAVLNRLITRDLDRYTTAPTFVRYNKDDIAKFLSNPYR